MVHPFSGSQQFQLYLLSLVSLFPSFPVFPCFLFSPVSLFPSFPLPIRPRNLIQRLRFAKNSKVITFGESQIVAWMQIGLFVAF